MENPNNGAKQEVVDKESIAKESVDRNQAIMDEVHDPFEETVTRESYFGIEDKPPEEPKKDEAQAPVVEKSETSVESPKPGDAPGKPAEDPKAKAKAEGLMHDNDPRRFQKNIGRVVYQREELRRQLAERDSEIARLKAGKPAEKPPESLEAKEPAEEKTETKPAAKPVVDQNTKPKLEDFESYEEFIEALTDWKTERSIQQRLAEYESRQTAKRDEEAVSSDMDTRIAEATKEFPDFESVAFAAEIPYGESPVLAEAVATSPLFSKVAYHLGKNPELAKSIAKMGPVETARAIGRIEAMLEAEDAPPLTNNSPKPTKIVSKAPPPITPVNANSGVVKKAPEDETDEEYYRRREKEIAEESGY